MSTQPTPAHPEIMAAEAATATAPDAPLPPATMTTSRLILRPLHPSDAASMQRQCEPASITKYMSLAFAHPYTMEHAVNFIAASLKEGANNLVLCEKGRQDVAIGGIGIKPGSDVQAHTAEVGYWVGEDFWGKGYLTEALEAMTEWTFTVKGDTCRRLWAGVFHENTASMRVLEKCGYRKEGVLRGHVEARVGTQDLHVFGLLKSEWEERQRSKTS